MNQYEVAILYDPGLEVDLTKAEERVKKIFTDNGGKVLSIDNWGKKKLAYSIKKHEHALYVFYQISLDPKNIKQVESTLNITNEVIRFLIVKQDLKELEKIKKLKSEKKAKLEGRKKSEVIDDHQVENLEKA
jgi:small subunit ribosomal protein S6